MLKRILTSAVGLIIFFALLFFPNTGMPFNIAVCVVTAIMLYEVYNSAKTHVALKILGYLSAAAILISVMIYFNISYIFCVMLGAYFIAMVFLHGDVKHTQISFNCIFTYYISFFMSSLITLRNDFGVFGVLLVFVCAWITDTGAYFSGRFFGNHKLIPKVSPKKTIEGAIGGILLCILCVVLYIHVLKLIPSSNIALTVLFAGVASILAQFGDLIASSVKRDCNVKDFGNLLPGHGGLMDRFDSVLFIAPFVLYLLKLI